MKKLEIIKYVTHTLRRVDKTGNLETEPSREEKSILIKEGVRRAVSEYGEVFRKLANE